MLILQLPCNIFPNNILTKQHEKLFKNHENLLKELIKYAYNQGYANPNAATIIVLHELIQIDSAIKKGFFTQKGYLIPYIGSKDYPELKNKDISKHITPIERNRINDIMGSYVRYNPTLSLPNVLGEINAYAQTIGYMKLIKNYYKRYKQYFKSYIYLFDIYLRVIKQTAPVQYLEMQNNKALFLTVKDIIMEAHQKIPEAERSDMEANVKNIVAFINKDPV